jgi:hypothetical protein
VIFIGSVNQGPATSGYCDQRALEAPDLWFRLIVALQIVHRDLPPPGLAADRETIPHSSGLTALRPDGKVSYSGGSQRSIYLLSVTNLRQQPTKLQTHSLTRVEVS